MGITVKDTGSSLAFPFKWTEADSARVAEAVRTSIVKRTEKGLSADSESPFPPYTDAYAEKKGQSLVDLKLTGKMLNSLTVILTNSGFRIDLPPAEEAKARGLEEGGRFFMGLTDSTIAVIEETVEAIITEKLTSSGRSRSIP